MNTTSNETANTLGVSKEAAQEAWREKYVYPLQRMFSGTGVFFTLSLFDMDRELTEACQRKGLPIGSMATMMGELVSPEAATLYRAMLDDSFPY